MYLNNVLSFPNPLIQLWQLLIHVSTCFISQSFSPTKEISFTPLPLFFFYLLNAEISFSPGQSKNWVRGNYYFFHYISFWSARRSFSFFFFFAEKTIKYVLQFTFKCFNNIRGTLVHDCGFNSLLSELISFSSSITERVFMSFMQLNNGKSLEIRYEARLFHLNKCVCVCHRRK